MDWQLTCRVCLETGDMVSLFDWDENNEQLATKYAYCCGVEIEKEDTLPTLICLNCVDKLTFAYQFKQQCMSSNETLKECLAEFMKSSAAVSEPSTTASGTETITIKQENGVLLQYDLPIEQETTWMRTLTKSEDKTVVTKAPGPKKRGRPRKYPNELGQIDISPYQRKKPLPRPKETQSLTALLEMKEDPDAQPGNSQDEDSQDDNAEAVEGADFDNDDDADFFPDEELDAQELEDNEELEPVVQPKKRGRPRKKSEAKDSTVDDDGEDVLLKETIMAFSEPIPEHLLNPKPKAKKKKQTKKYNYEKSHTCETCGTSFTSNASLQAHIRRHLGIKPFVCSICGYSCVLNTELRRHMMRHTGDKPYKCRICERRFGDFGSRQKHERLHMGVRPYKCTVCGKSFTYSYVLSNHMLTHTGVKKYSCSPCNKKFTKAHHLRYHNKVHHKELYKQQVAEAEAKKMRQQLNIANMPMYTGHLVEGKMEIVSQALASETPEVLMQVEDDDSAHEADGETHRAVAEIEGVGALTDEIYDEIKTE